jgi:hypothetical protein
MSETPTPPTLEQRAEQIVMQTVYMPSYDRKRLASLILSALQDVRAEALQEQKTETK